MRSATSSMNRTILMMTLLFVPALAHAQAADDNKGWSFSQRFQGSTNSMGTVLKETSTATYNFNDHFKAYGGVPFYFTKESGSTGSSSFVNGIGNVYSGLFALAGDPSKIRYVSDLSFTLPTGDMTRGFSTGHPTVDWTSTVVHTFGSFIPYGSAGIANTMSDTSFFVQPFSVSGFVTHYEAGALFNANSHVGFGGSAYGMRASGTQQSLTPAKNGNASAQPGNTPLLIANDHGFYGWVRLK